MPAPKPNFNLKYLNTQIMLVTCVYMTCKPSLCPFQTREGYCYASLPGCDPGPI